MHLAAIVILTGVSLFGIVGNTFIIGAVILQRQLRTLGNVFIVNLAVADLVVVSFIMPLGLTVSQAGPSVFFTHPVFCKVQACVYLTMLGVSTTSLTLISLDRYLHVCRFSFYRKYATKNRMALVVVFCWVYTLVFSIQGFTGWTMFRYGHTIYLCTFSVSTSPSYSLYAALVGVVLPFVVMVFSYSRIFVTIKQSSNKLNTHVGEQGNLPRRENVTQNEKTSKLLKMLLITVVVYALFWLPVMLFLPLASVAVEIPGWTYTLCDWAAISNASVNSVIYGVTNEQFRKGYRKLVMKLCRRDRPVICENRVTVLNTVTSPLESKYPPMGIPQY